MMSKGHVYPLFWSALTKEESNELSKFTRKLQIWLMHIEYVNEYNKDKIKKKLPERLEIDQSNSPTDEEFIYANSLRDKMYRIPNSEQT